MRCLLLVAAGAATFSSSICAQRTVYDHSSCTVIPRFKSLKAQAREVIEMTVTLLTPPVPKDINELVWRLFETVPPDKRWVTVQGKDRPVVISTETCY
jgi:hypothetical protein